MARYKVNNIFQSTHPLRGATGKRSLCFCSTRISIHAPLAGCDQNRSCRRHLPWGFQSTHPLRGATASVIDSDFVLSISIHAPLAGCDKGCRTRLANRRNFNPRTPCGVRQTSMFDLNGDMPFQSTHPLRGATFALSDRLRHVQISIHAPLAGCDGKVSARTCRRRYFNPRTPCGVRPTSSHTRATSAIFQSTHPLRGATLPRPNGVQPPVISIHAPLAGCDNLYVPDPYPIVDFNPRTPCGVRLPRAYNTRAVITNFNPRTPCGVRHSPSKNGLLVFSFQSTHPSRGATFRG